MKVYEKVKAYLAAKDIDTAVLSDSTGIPQNRLSSLLNGEEVLYAKDLKSICLALNETPETFIDILGGNKS